MRNKIQVVPGWDPALYHKIERKVGRLDRGTMLDFADVAGSGMSRAFGDFRREGDERSLLEIEAGLQTLWAIVQRLKGEPPV